MSNPFNDRLDWTFQGKRARVYGQDRVYEGWINRIHHKRGSVVLHNADDVTGDTTRHLGSVFVRVAQHIEELEPQRTIRRLQVADIENSRFNNADYTPTDYHMRRAYRNGFAGSFPVVRPIQDLNGDVDHYELINGHKRVEAMRRVGLDAHACEIIECSDEVAEELFNLAHRDQAQEDLPLSPSIDTSTEADDD